VVKVSIEVHSNSATSFIVAVQAGSIHRAMSIVKELYPSDDLRVRVKFPIDPEGFFVKNPVARAGVVGFEQRSQRPAA
jgi:hypothetical protein